MIVLIEIVVSLVGAVPLLSPLQRAVPFAVLTAVLVVRGLFRSSFQARQVVSEA